MAHLMGTGEHMEGYQDKDGGPPRLGRRVYNKRGRLAVVDLNRQVHILGQSQVPRSPVLVRVPVLRRMPVTRREPVTDSRLAAWLKSGILSDPEASPTTLLDGFIRSLMDGGMGGWRTAGRCGQARSSGGGSRRASSTAEDNADGEGEKKQKMWLTPRASETDESSEKFVKRNADRGAHCHGTLTSQVKAPCAKAGLRTAVRRNDDTWATPRADKTSSENPETWRKRHEAGKVSKMPLATQVNDCNAPWPTPTTQDAKNDAGPSQWNRNTLPLNTAVVAVRDGKPISKQKWATPTSTDYKGPDPAREENRSGLRHQGGKLADDVAKQKGAWPTPGMMDGHRTGKEIDPDNWRRQRDEKAEKGINKQLHLNVAVNDPGLMEENRKKRKDDPNRSGKRVDSVTTYKQLNTEVENKKPGKLNPRWVETLMGLPMGWTCPECPVEAVRDWPLFVTGLMRSEVVEEWMFKVANRTDELRMCGNGVVPAVVEKAYRHLSVQIEEGR